ncbi:unnamed protein product [Urochloa humidicola]
MSASSSFFPKPPLSSAALPQSPVRGSGQQLVIAAASSSPHHPLPRLRCCRHFRPCALRRPSPPQRCKCPMRHDRRTGGGASARVEVSSLLVGEPTHGCYDSADSSAAAAFVRRTPSTVASSGCRQNSSPADDLHQIVSP